MVLTEWSLSVTEKDIYLELAMSLLVNVLPIGVPSVLLRMSEHIRKKNIQNASLAIPNKTFIV